MLTRFTAFIKANQLFNENDRILLAVSGGLDSVVMCDLFQKTEFNFAIAHCNFELREAESEGDEIFTKKLAEKYNVNFFSESFSTEKFSGENKVSIQMAARDLRYKWFEEIREKNNFNFIATAHHQNDEIETFLINIIRGTGISGLHGINLKKNNIIRPLLFCTREEIEMYAKENKLDHREDSSNQSLKYIRNKLRNQVIPLLKEINPSLENTIKQEIETIKNVETVFNTAIDKKREMVFSKTGNETTISINELKKLQPLKIYLYEFLKEYDFSGQVVDEIIRSIDEQSGAQFFSSTHRIIKDREHLIISELKEIDRNVILINEGDEKINTPLNLIVQTLLKKDDLKIPDSKFIACLDHNLLSFPLTLRVWQKGDCFQPFGMQTNKNISDFLTDIKLPLNKKEETYVLVSNNEIIWVVGYRISEKYKIKNSTTKMYLIELHQ